MTQQLRVLEYMEQNEGITSMQAFRDLGIVKLSNRISELQQKGIMIGKRWEEGVNRWGEPTRYLKYYLPEVQK